MFEYLNHRAGHYLLLLAAGACLCLINLGGPSLWDLDEGRNATAALEMYESGNWIVPTFNGKLRSHKPVLLYWLQTAAYEAFGVNEFAARLPSALAALLTVLAVYELGRQHFNPATGLLGGLALASSVLFCASAHFANPDALLLAFSTVTIVLFWIGVSQHRRAVLAAAGLPAGLAVLAKGPVGLVLPAGVAIVFLLWSGRWRLLFDRVWWLTGLLCALVALPWYILVSIDTKREFLLDFLLTHNLERALNPMEDHSGPPWYYIVVLLAGLVPWSAFLGSAIWCGLWSTIRVPWCSVRGAWHRARDFEGRDPVDAYRLLMCWIGVYLVVFSVAATKLPNYILPAVPPLALLIARPLDRWRRGTLDLPRWVQPTSLFMLALIGATMAIALLAAGGWLELRILRGRTWPGLENWAFLGVILITGAVAAAWCLWRQRRVACIVVVAGTALGFVAPLAGAGSTALNAFRAPRPLVEQAGALQRDREIRVGCYQLEFLPSLNFYVQRNVQHHDSIDEVLEFLGQPLPVYLFLPRNEWDQLCSQSPLPYRVLASHREMYRVGEVVVVTNR